MSTCRVMFTVTVLYWGMVFKFNYCLTLQFEQHSLTLASRGIGCTILGKYIEHTAVIISGHILHACIEQSSTLPPVDDTLDNQGTYYRQVLKILA